MLASSQPACNIPGILAECSPSVAMFGTFRQGTFREHFEEKYFLKSSRWKCCVCVKSVWFDNNKCWSLANFSNPEVMFPEYSRNISQMSLSENFQGYP